MALTLNPLTGRLEETNNSTAGLMNPSNLNITNFSDINALNTANSMSGAPSAMPENTATTSSPVDYDQLINQAYSKIGRYGVGAGSQNIDQEGYDYWKSQLQSGAISPNDFQTKFLESAANYSGSDMGQYQGAINLAKQQRGQIPTNPYGVTGANPYTGSADPYIQATQQTALGNLAGAQAATAANRVNQYTPYGNLEYRQTGVDAQGNPIWSATQSMSPELQDIYGSLTKSAQGTYSQGFNPNLPSVGINPGESYEQAIMRRLQPTQERQSKQLDVQLANQGIMPGSEAYNTAKTQLSQAQNDQLTSAVVGGFSTGLAANQQQFAQDAAKYQMPLNQLNAFRSASSPNYVAPYNQGAIAGPDYLTAYNQSQQNQIAANAAAQSGQNAVTGGLFDIGSSLLGSSVGGKILDTGIKAIGGLFSDIRMKEKINLVGKTLSGINLYEFEYKPEFKEIAGNGKFIGVMAQEVEKVIPDAVIETSIGYKAVDYSKIN